MEHFDEIKNNPTYSANTSKHAHGKVWNIFLIFTFLKREIHHLLVNFFKVSGRSIEEILRSTLPYILIMY